jgi:5'-3' exonuclease
MQKNRYSNTAVIDGDYILWISCNGNKVDDGTGRPLRRDGKFVYTDKTVEQAINTCDAYMADILNLTHADSYILCLTGQNNFRAKIDPTYKANRIGMEKPLWFEAVKEHMRTHWDAVEIESLEADDVASIIYHNLEKTFIIAVDKDLLECIPGRHFDARRGQNVYINTTESQAEFNFAKSILTGDAIDGISNMKKGYGPKTAEKDLLASEETTPLLAALKIYQKEFGDEEGLARYTKQKSLLKMIDSLEELPEGVTFALPEPNCYNCIETEFSGEEYWLELNEEEDDLHNRM